MGPSPCPCGGLHPGQDSRDRRFPQEKTGENVINRRVLVSLEEIRKPVALWPGKVVASRGTWDCAFLSGGLPRGPRPGRLGLFQKWPARASTGGKEEVIHGVPYLSSPQSGSSKASGILAVWFTAGRLPRGLPGTGLRPASAQSVSTELPNPGPLDTAILSVPRLAGGTAVRWGEAGERAPTAGSCLMQARAVGGSVHVLEPSRWGRGWHSGPSPTVTEGRVLGGCGVWARSWSRRSLHGQDRVCTGDQLG